MKTCVLTGSFDPITEGHLFLLRQALRLFDKVYLTALVNPDKRYSLSLGERLRLMREAVRGMDRVEVSSSDGYACDFCKKVGADVMVRGIRNAEDLAYETDLRKRNLEYGGVDTIFILSDDEHRGISSTAERKKREK